jgi:radical SAM protein with 4Fe4S-binding SPASM domain
MGRLRYDGDPRKTVRWWNGPTEPPGVVVWEITLKCNLGCRHCGSRAGAARAEELSTAEALDVVRQLAEIGVREVTLIGGEAYLRDDWSIIAESITRSGMACTMVTGGRDFDALCLQEALAAGVKYIGVSIDGLAATHDTLRGVPGSFESALDSARRIAATGTIGLGVNTQINRLSMPELPALAELLVGLGAHAWQIQLTVPLGRAADRPGLLLQPYHLVDLFPLLDAIKRDILDPGGVQLVPGNNVGYFGPYERVLRYGGAAGHVWSGCNAGRASLGLEADGKVKGCPSLPSSDYTGGNVRERPIREIWRQSAEVRGLGERTVADLWGYCRTCEHAARCKAGCTWTSHALFGRPGNNPYCHHRALELASRGLRERVELIKAAPGEPFDYGRFQLVTEPFDVDGESDEISPVVRSNWARMFDAGKAGSWPAQARRDILRKQRPTRAEGGKAEPT